MAAVSAAGPACLTHCAPLVKCPVLRRGPMTAASWLCRGGPNTSPWWPSGPRSLNVPYLGRDQWQRHRGFAAADLIPLGGPLGLATYILARDSGQGRRRLCLSYHSRPSNVLGGLLGLARQCPSG